MNSKRVEKNIYFCYGYNVRPYAVNIKVAKVKYQKYFSTVDEARAYRDKKLSLKTNKCKGCGKLTQKFNTKFCSDCKRKSSKHRLASPVNYLSVFPERLTVDEKPRKSADGNIECVCYKCGKYFEPYLSQILGRTASLQGVSAGSKNLYCSDKCKEECSTFGQKSYPKTFLPLVYCMQKLARFNQRESKSAIIEEQIRQYSYTFCEKCGNKREDLHLHHTELIADNYDDIDKSVNPLTHMLMCKGCHEETHVTC